MTALSPTAATGNEANLCRLPFPVKSLDNSDALCKFQSCDAYRLVAVPQAIISKVNCAAQAVLQTKLGISVESSAEVIAAAGPVWAIGDPRNSATVTRPNTAVFSVGGL